MQLQGECGAVIEATFNAGVQLKPRLFKQKELVVFKEPFYKSKISPKLGLFEGEEVCLLGDKLFSMSKELNYQD